MEDELVITGRWWVDDVHTVMIPVVIIIASNCLLLARAVQLVQTPMKLVLAARAPLFPLHVSCLNVKGSYFSISTTG